VNVKRTLGVWGSLVVSAACSCSGSSSTNDKPGPNSEADATAGTDGNAIDGTLPADGGATRPLPAVDGAASDGAAVDGATEAGSVASSLIHYLGRFDTRDPAGPRFAFPGSAIAVTFHGTGMQVALSDSGTSYFTVVVDGGAPSVVPTSGANHTYTLASKLTAGQHTLVLTKRTESDVGVVQFLGFTTQGGALVASPDPFARRIEYVGDSITCGYGDLGVGPNCSFSASTEDETVAYGALAAAALNAQQTVVAYSGKGVYRNYDGSTTGLVPALFELTLPDDPTSTWGFATPPPDVVVVNLGTNDFAMGDPGVGFEQAYEAFLRTIRQHYPKAYVVCTMSPMSDATSRAEDEGYVQAAIQDLASGGDARVSALGITGADGGPTWGFEPQLASNGYGCDSHPSGKTQKLMGQELTAALKTLLGW
jgi:lysophospholipase L1-like esterase